MQYSKTIRTSCGYLQITANNTALIICRFIDKNTKINTPHSPILEEAQKQLTAYLQGKLKKFDLPLATDGTEFQKKVWRALLKIPYGETRSYQDIAADINHPNAARAVGNANGKNPLCIFIPCHRVICASGDIGGYSGGVRYKEKLLAVEDIL